MQRPWLSLFLFVVATLGGSLRAQAQSNDSFANRLTLTGPAPIAVSNNLHATRETNEPNHAGAAGGRSLWYTWTAPATGTVNFSTYYTGTGAPTMRAVTVYTGGSLDALAEVASSNNQAQALYAAGSYTSLLLAGGTSFSASVTAGTVYQIAVDAVTTPTLVTDDGTVVLAINAPPTVLSTASITGTTGINLTYMVAASAGVTTFAATELPAGLSINTGSGQITGAPAAAGTYTFDVSATGPGGTGTGTVALRVSNPSTGGGATTPPIPTMTNAASVRGFVGTAFSFALAGSGTPTSFAADSLPSGLLLNGATGVISGTPTTPGTYTVPIAATNATGTGTATLTIAIYQPPAPIITSALAISGTVGTSLSYFITTNLDNLGSGVAPTARTATNLPPGVTKSASATYFSGTPTAAGVYAVPISVTSPGGTHTAVVTITVAASGTVSNPNAPAPPVLGSAATAWGMVGTAFSYGLTATNVPTCFTASGLPPGVSLNATTGVISGTPTTAGTYTVPVSAKNSYGTSTGTLLLMVYADVSAQAAANGTALPIITSPAMVGGYVGTALNYTATAEYQGNGIYSDQWTYAVTGLPPGVTLVSTTSANGSVTISGTPTAAGTYTATISATYPGLVYNYISRPAVTGTAKVSFLVLPAAGAPPTLPVITSAAEVNAATNASLSYATSATNSPTGYAASGLPPGVSINAATGRVSGKPTTSGTYAATISATNAAGAGSATVTFAVASRPPVFSDNAQEKGQVGKDFHDYISAANSPTSYAASGLPPGLSMDMTSSTVTGVPTQAGDFPVTITASNAEGATSEIIHYIIEPAVYLPVIRSDAVYTVTVGKSCGAGFAPSNTTASSYTASNLPPGLTLYDSYVSGTPTVAGTYFVPVSATNAAGTGTATITFVVNPGDPPNLSREAMTTTTVGQYFYFAIFSDDGSSTYTFPGGLPAGLSGNATGVISGTPTTAGTYPVRITATNATGPRMATLTLVVLSSGASATKPVFGSSLGLVSQGRVGLGVTWTLATTPAATSYAASGLPPGLSLDATTGKVSGTPTTAGVYTTTFTAANGAGTSTALTTYVIYGTEPVLPKLTLQAAIVGYAGCSFTATNDTYNGPAATYTANGLPPGLSMNATTGTITGTPTNIGQSVATISATAAAVTITAKITFTIKSASALQPALAGSAEISTQVLSLGNADYRVDLGDPSVYGLSSGFTGGMTYTYAVSGLPDGVGFAATHSPNSLEGVTLKGAPTAPGTYPLAITVTSSAGASQTINPVLVVRPRVLSMITSAAGASGNALTAFTYNLTIDGFYGDFVSAQAGTLPNGLSLNPATGLISGVPTTAGTYAVPVGITTTYGTSTATVTFRIDPPQYGGLPILSSAAGISSQDFPPDATTLVSFLSPVASYAFAAVNGPATFTVGNVPVGMAFNPATGVLSGTPAMVGTYQLPVTATNSLGAVSTTLTLAANSPRATARPALSYSGYVGGSFSAGTPFYLPAFLSSFATGSGYSTSLDPVSYSAAGLPPGLSMNSYTGQIAGTPTKAGTYAATITAGNRGGSGSATTMFAITDTAQAAGAAPVLGTGNRAEAAGFLGVPINYALTTTGGVTSYAATNLPAGLSFDAARGVISGTPLVTGTTAATVSASNSAGTTLATLTVTVESAPIAPVITAPCVTLMNVGSTFSLSPAVSSFSGMPAPTSYAATGLPAGLDINPYTGLISGTPSGPVGTYTVPVRVSVGPAAAVNATLTFIVRAAPSNSLMSSPAGALALLYNPFSYAIRSTNFSPVAGSLPAGLAYQAAGGTISGYPQDTGTNIVALKSPANYTAAVTVRALAPTLSLPRPTAQPVGGTVMEGSGFILSFGAIGVPAPSYQWYLNDALVPGATGATLALNSTTSSDSGNYRCVAMNAAGNVMSTEALLLVQTTYAHWQVNYFTAQEIAAGSAADDVSFSGDSVPNLIKYALGLDPRSVLTMALPVAVTRPGASGALQIEFDRAATRADIEYLVEASPDLGMWTAIATSDAGAATANLGAASVNETVATTSDTGIVGYHVTVKALPPPGQRQFLRLRMVRH